MLRLARTLLAFTAALMIVATAAYPIRGFTAKYNNPGWTSSHVSTFEQAMRGWSLGVNLARGDAIGGAHHLQKFPHGPPPPKTWYVDSEDGSDSTDSGSKASPFKSITYALERAGEGETIRVAVGVPYDEANGETFPMQMKLGVHLQGIPIPVIDGVLLPEIRGGAVLDLSGTYRYVGILCADEATISQFRLVPVENPAEPGSRVGTAILCDSTSPLIEDNVFVGDEHAGIATVGTAHPLIRDNDFRGDLDWGITAYAESYPTIESNLFTTRNGVDASNSSYPTIRTNAFSCESTGVSTKGTAHAVIVDNTISDNDEYGIVVRMDSEPVIQGNEIKGNPTGVLIGAGTPLPDLGGGGESSGDNVFANTDWDVENWTPNTIFAQNNRWSNLCCDLIDRRINDDDENPAYGSVDFSTTYCMVCSVRLYLPLITGQQ